jgi:transposase
MDVEQLRQDVADGNVSLDRLVDLIASQQGLIASQQGLIEKLQNQVAEQQKKIDGKNPTERLDEQYSEKAEEKRQAKGKKRKRPKPRRRGRISTAEKIAKAARTEQVYPDGVDPEQCKLSHTRVVWRFEDGRSVLVAYEVYRFRNSFGQPPGVLGRSEYGIEILISLGYQVYCLGLSLDKACKVMCFFQSLQLTKSQANSLLNQLARSWEKEFDSLCMLLANSAVVYCDETGWSINSVWTFLTSEITLMFYGVHKDAATLQQILDKEVFQGVLVSDDAAVYQGFSKSQKCWAHLLRKAIKLTLQAPEDETYREFADTLLAIYREAKKVASDKRFGDAGRQRRVAELDDQILALCYSRWIDEGTEAEGAAGDYRRLVHEIMRLMLAQELFVFVTTVGVEGNNNSSERELRDDAHRRATGRTNKMPSGAKRQTVISSVLRTLDKQLSRFTLDGVIDEVKRWLVKGRGCFTDQAEEAGLSPAAPGLAKDHLLSRIILDVDKPDAEPELAGV